MDSSLLIVIWIKVSILWRIILSLSYAIPWTAVFKYKSFKKMLCYSLLAFICLVQFFFIIVFTWNYMGIC